MMDYYNRPQFRFGFGSYLFTPGVKYLLFANGGVYFLQFLFGNQLIGWFGLHPSTIFHNFFLWQFFSYMFLHGGFLHLFFNMFMLWIFGIEVERNWGTREFLKFYVICGVGAGFFHLLFMSVAVIGASGAVYGVMIAFVMLYPDRLLFFFPFPVPLKAKYWAIIFIGISLIFGILGGGQTAHLAHLGGIIVGFLYIKFGSKLNFNDFIYRKKMEFKLQRRAKRRQRILKIKKEVDLILDKINEVGYQNLSEHEIKVLKEASELLSNDNEDIEN